MTFSHPPHYKDTTCEVCVFVEKTIRPIIEHQTRIKIESEIRGLELHEENCPWFGEQPCTCNLRIILKVIRGEV